MITPRENLKALLNGGSPSWVPFSLDVGAIPGFTAPVMDRFRAETGATDPAEYFDYDYRLVSLSTRFGGEDPRAGRREMPAETSFDEWGIGHWAGGAVGTYERMFPPLATAGSTAEVERWPEPIIEPGSQTAKAEAFHRRGYPVFAYAGSLYEWSWWLRGMTDFLMDMAADPAMADAILHKVERYTTRLASTAASLGADVLCFYDDAGMQSGLQMSPATWRRFIKPCWQRILDRLRREHPQARFFYHSCGKITEIVPDVVELGFHILHPVQPECMDFADLHRRYGSRIVLAATVSAQQTMPFGTAADIRTAVEHLLAVVGEGRRCFLFPSNRLQPETPWANVVAFAETARAARARAR